MHAGPVPGRTCTKEIATQPLRLPGRRVVRRHTCSSHTVVAKSPGGAGVEGSLRLTDGGDDDNDPASGLGVLEIFHAGAWGTVCNGDPQAPSADDYVDSPSLPEVRQSKHFPIDTQIRSLCRFRPTWIA